VGFEKRRTSCKIVIARITFQGARHVDCCPEIAGCQEELRRTAKGMSKLQWGDISTSGASEEACGRSALSECAGVSVSMLPVAAAGHAPPDRSGVPSPEGTRRMLDEKDRLLKQAVPPPEDLSAKMRGRNKPRTHER
jgi:hypothetical protein